ncbi:MAG: type II toxin-antitoxin system RelE/ParE family toxin [Phascolarctobacterium sp.]|nr:type II toxin-antitoxin system RelE/ParE family toxin [Phascolarctobacterium sp.]MBR6636153.1 type II toxin-antitoxin system RelE/ParE family toxin [Phascolarctobacterium sp.]
MNKTYGVILTPYAQKHLRNIFYYIHYELKAEMAAKSVLNSLKGAIDSLSFYPARHLLVELEPFKSKGLRKMVVKNYLIYFKIYEPIGVVRVVAVIYAKSNQIERLKELGE